MLAVTSVPSGTSCPKCGLSLLSPRDAAPWCGNCEYGLDVLEGRGDFGWRWLDRIAYRRAFRAATAEFRRRSTGPDRGPGWHPRTILLVAVSILLYAAVLACLIVGVWLCTLSFPGFALVPGIALILVAVELRPRFGRIPRYATVLSQQEAPHLHALVAQVADAVEAPAPSTICVDEDLNASAGTYGLARRTLLVIGLPLWHALSPQQRVALLGHEMGHFVNGDPRRGLLIQPAYEMLARVADLLRPGSSNVIEGASASGNRVTEAAGLLTLLANLVTNAVLAVLRMIITVMRVALEVLALRDGQAAEYRADGLAAKEAGSTAATQLMDLFVMDETVRTLVWRDARTGVPPTRWRDAVADALAGARTRMPLRRQLSVRRDVSLFASHPPAGLRARLVEQLPGVSAAVALGEEASSRIDDELAKHSTRAARTLRSG